MSDNNNSNQDPSDRYEMVREGFFRDILTQVKLIMRLMADDRVNALYKLLPIAPLVYFILPDPLIGPVDDVALLWMGSYLFIELCPKDVVQEHLDEIQGTDSTKIEDENDIIDGEFRDVD